MKTWIAFRLSRIPPTCLRALGRVPGRLGLVPLSYYHRALLRFPLDFVQIARPGFAFAGNTQDVIQRHIYVHGVWEPQITDWVRNNLRAGDTVLDVGANTGYFSLLAASCVGSTGRVVAIEPVPTIYSMLLRNLSLNPSVTVHTMNVAVGDTSGEVEIFRASSENIGSSATQPTADSTSEGLVERQTLDQVAARLDLENLRLLKIDTEGDEGRVLAGASNLLRSIAPGGAVLVEVTPDLLEMRGDAVESVWRHFPASEWTPFQVLNDYTIKSYARRVAGGVNILDGPVRSRADVIFVRKAIN